MQPSQTVGLYSVVSRSLKPVVKFAKRNFGRKLICLALMLSLLVLPVHSPFFEGAKALASTTVKVVSGIASQPDNSVAWFFNWLFGSRQERKAKRETLAERLAAVSRLQISPGKFVGYQGQTITFSAQGLNVYDQTIQGLRFSWESSDPDKVRIDDSGSARFLQPGRVTLTCRAGFASASVIVLVRPGNRPLQTDEDWRRDQDRLQFDGASGVGSYLPSIPRLFETLAPTAQAQSGGPDDLGYDQLWSDPANLVGSPLNRLAEATRIGSLLPEGSNFEFSAPIINLGGRGLETHLTLFYNSRVWSRRNNALAFDAIVGEPSPGFQLGFGRIVAYEVSPGPNSTCKYMLIDPDGTRHYLGSGSYQQTGTYTTTDGTNITYVGNATNGGTLIYSNGTNALVQVVNNRLVPTQVLDTNGNYLTITYKTESSDGHGGIILWPPLKIDYVTDTLGRQIQFNYDSSFRLTSITSPGFGGTVQNPVTDTLVKFDYQTVTVTTNFSGLTVERSGGSFSGLKHVYFPATNNGYLFTYSGYGMIYNVSLRKEMSLSFQGVIQDGNERAAVNFNYPTSGSTLQTGVPAFTQRTESAVNAPTATYTYSSSINTLAQTKTFTTTRPDSSTVNLTRSTNASSIANGLLTKSEIKNSSGTTFAKTDVTYVSAAGAPFLQSLTNYDDANAPTKTDFDYDSYGNIANKREYGSQISGAWQARRRTHFTYGVSYRHNLATLVETFDAQQNTNDADDVLIAKTSNTYDDYAASGGMEVYPNLPNPPGHLGWGAETTVRGNLTGTTEWYDLANNLSITRLRKLDKFGNVLKEDVSCCNQKIMTTSDANGYVFPDAVMSGNENGVHMAEAIEVDYNTGLLNTTTSANNQQLNYNYDGALRMNQMDVFTGANASINYSDGNLSASFSANYVENSANKAVTGSVTTDGWGRPIQSVDKANNQVNTSYDSMGRMQSKTNPFPAGQTPGPSTTFQYDVLGRLTQTTLPDGNISQISYSGLTTTTTDPVNRKTREETDGLGRLVKVTEQDATGALAQDTTLTYNLLDKLTQSNQGGQLRSYKYDNLGRLLYERIPEQIATINDGTGTLWTAKYTYTTSHQLATKTDARGVVTTYGYDDLNRLTSVSFDTSGASGVAATPGESYTYDNTENSPTNGKLLSVGVGSVYGEEYTYSGNNLLSSVKHKIGTTYQYTAGYQRNTLGQVTQLTYPSGLAVGIFRDSFGRLKQIGGAESQNNGYLNNVTYNAAGAMAGFALGNGITETFSYDSQRLLLTNKAATKSGSTLMNLTFSYAAQAGQNGANSTAGNSGAVMSTSGTINSATESSSYTYDLNKRIVTSAQTTSGITTQRRFTYDRWSNRASVYDATSGGTQIQAITLQQSGGAATNRITSETRVVNGGSSEGGGTTTLTLNYSYDNNGNVTNDGLHTFTYDAKNRIVSVDSGVYTFAYDHQNRRVKKVYNSTITHYVWDDDQVIAEYDGSTGSLNVNYIFVGKKMVAKVQGGTTRYALDDKLSIRATADTSGAVVGQQGHLPFGEISGSSGSTDKHRFTKYERDETNLDYAVNRYYASDTGRFRSVDPKSGDVREPQSLNRYAYVSNDPINSADPQGLEDGPDCGGGGVYDAGSGECADPPYIDGWDSISVSAGDDDSDPNDSLPHDDDDDTDGPPNTGGGDTSGGSDQNPKPPPLAVINFKCKEGPILTINGNSLTPNSKGGASITLDAPASKTIGVIASSYAGHTVSIAPNTELSINPTTQGGAMFVFNPPIEIVLAGPNVNVSSVTLSKTGEVIDVQAAMKLAPDKLVEGVIKKQINKAMAGVFADQKDPLFMLPDFGNIAKIIRQNAEKNKTGICATFNLIGDGKR